MLLPSRPRSESASWKLLFLMTLVIVPEPSLAICTASWSRAVNSMFCTVTAPVVAPIATNRKPSEPVTELRIFVSSLTAVSEPIVIEVKLVFVLRISMPLLVSVLKSSTIVF